MSLSNLLQNVEARTSQGTKAEGERPAAQPRVVFSEARMFFARPSTPLPESGVPATFEAEADAEFLPWAGCLMVGVKKSNHPDCPSYRISIGTILEDGRFVSSVESRSDLQSFRLGSVRWDNTFVCLARLVQVAEEWIHADQLWNVDKFVQRSGGGDPSRGPSVKRTGKTERNRARGKAKPKKD